MNDITLAQLVELHKLYRRPSEATFANYYRIQQQFTRETGIEKLLDLYDEDVKPKIIAWRNVIIDRASAITFNNYLTHLRALVNFAIQEEIVDKPINPLVSISKVKHYKPVKKVVEIPLLTRCINYLSQDEEPLAAAWFWRIAINFLYGTGVRRSQFVNVKWKDIDFKRKLLNTSSNKSKKEWDIPLSDDVVEDLLYLLRRSLTATNSNLKDEDFVFRIALFNRRFECDDEEVLQMKPDQLSKFLGVTLSKAIGIKISPHRLRHTMGTLIANDPSVKDTGGMKALQEIMGHASVSTTFGYVHPDMGHLRKTQSTLPKIA